MVSNGIMTAPLNLDQKTGNSELRLRLCEVHMLDKKDETDSGAAVHLQSSKIWY